MPKTYLPHQKQRWLRLYESGKSEKRIASDAKVDYRTVKKGIEEARRERNAMSAQIELVKEALSDHKDQLLLKVDEMAATVVMPPDTLEIRKDNNGSTAPIPLTRATVRINESSILVIDVHAEGKVTWELLQEHLKRDKIWKSYKEWKEVVLTYIKAGIDLKSAAAALIKDKTGLEIGDKTTDKDETSRVYSTTVQTFYEVASRRALKRIDGTNLEGRMVASPDGYVRNGPGGTELAYSPQEVGKCRGGLLSALESLYRSSEFERVTTSFDRLQEVTDRTRRIIDEISLLRMLPGSCRVCRRLGIK
ncbi:MAG: hypothetical protein HY530_06465 [Chloroflexi bacterium]|nr:hypothetical protein [Chloroflexota bacterium]